MNVMSSGDGNRSNEAEGESRGATGPVRRLGGEGRDHGPKTASPFSPGA